MLTNNQSPVKTIYSEKTNIKIQWHSLTKIT